MAVGDERQQRLPEHAAACVVDDQLSQPKRDSALRSASALASKRRSLRELLLPLLPTRQPEEPRAEEEMSKFWRWAWTVVLWYTIFSIGVALAMLGPTLQELAHQLHLPLASAAMIFTIRAAGYVVGSVCCGDLLERLSNAAAVFLLPLLPCCVGQLLLPHVASHSEAAVLFLAQGMSMGVLDTGGNVVMLALWRGSPYQNGFEHAFHFLFGVGAAVAPLVVRHMLENGYEAMLAWRVVGMATLPACIGLLVLVFAPQPKTSHPEVHEKGDFQRYAAKVTLLTGAFLFVYVGIEVAFGGYIDVFSVRWIGASTVEGATLTTIYWAFLSIGRFVAAVVTPFVHHARYLGIHLLLAILAIAAMGFATSKPGHVGPEGQGWWYGMVLPTALFGFALAPLFPGALLVAEELLGGPLPTRQAGLVVGAAAAGEMLLPMLVGVCFAYDPPSFCWLQLVFCLASASIFLVNSAGILGSKKT